MTVRDDYKRIYGKCQETLLFRTMLTTVEHALDYAEKKGGNDRFVCGGTGWSYNGGLDKVKQHGMHFELLHDVQQLAYLLRDDYVAQFGPRLSVEGPRASFNRPHILTFCFDNEHIPLCRFALPEYFEWNNSGLARAATAYQRTCGWDFAPDEAGMWLCYYLITDGIGSSNNKKWSYNGNLVGFVILHDRENDGQYTSLAHIWTAAAARRHGVANALVVHARKHFPLRAVEGPLTDNGAALFRRVWPEVLK